MSDPSITAAREIVEESIEGIRGAIAGLPADALNWRPSKEGTNPIAVLAVHAMHSTRSWLAVAMGAPLPDRDRDAEFRTVVAGPRELLATVDRLVMDCRAILTTEDAFEPGTMRESHFRASSGRAETSSARGRSYTRSNTSASTWGMRTADAAEGPTPVRTCARCRS
jgi:hypothetical protein